MKKELKRYSSIDLIHELLGRDDIYVINWYTIEFIINHYGTSWSKATAIIKKIKEVNYCRDDDVEFMHDLFFDMTNTPTNKIKSTNFY